jgi:heptosyltransferase-2
MDKSKIKRILVITLSNVGDIVLTTPVVEALLTEFPAARLEVMVGPAGREIFEKHQKVSGVIIYDKKSSPLDKFTLFLALRKKGYDLVVDLRNTILPPILGAKFITSPFRHVKKGIMHKKDLHLSRLTDMGINVSGAEFHIPVKERDKESAERMLGPLKVGSYVVVSPGAKSHVKRWPLKNFARLSDMIKEKLGLEAVLIGDRHDRIVAERMLFYMRTSPLNLIERTNISELAHIIKKGRLLITNDSAPLHIGSAVNSRILAFFGPTDHREYGPLAGAGTMVLRRDMKCSPCGVPQCINNGNKYECLRTISVEEAFRAVKELLGSAHTVNADR